MSQPYDRTSVKKLVIHHFGDGLPPATTSAELLRRSNPPQPNYPKGYQFPEYDFGIISDGTVIPLRPLNYIGAHTQSDIPQFNYGPNWWNQNSASIVLAMDAEKYEVPDIMISSLESFISSWCKDRGATVEDIYPHNKVTQTDCPGKNTPIAKILGSLNPTLEVKSMPCVVVYFGPWDLVPAARLGLKLNCPVYARDSSNWKTCGAEKFYIVGGEKIEGEQYVTLSGDTWELTTKEVLGVL